MKRFTFLYLIATVFVFSCSSDKENIMADANSIEGTWDATELSIDNNTASDDAKNVRDIFKFLTALDCHLLTFTFNTDLSVTAENAINYVEESFSLSGNGMEISCPTDRDTEASTYTFDGSVLTIVNINGSSISLDVTIDGNTMTIDATDLEIPNFNESGQLIFIKR